MRPQYTVLDYAPDSMIHTNKRLRNELICDGCEHPFNTASSYVTVITDRSGSEYAAAHLDDEDCIRMAVEGRGLYSHGGHGRAT
jgi:hypothetical protein